MSVKAEKLAKNIIDNLSFFSKSISMENAIGFFDSNRSAQDIFAGLFKRVFGYEGLKELDKLNDIPNFPSIDLADSEAKIAFQITTRKDKKKIEQTIEKFIKHKLYEKYNRLIIYVIGCKKPRYTEFNSYCEFEFKKERDIWDDNFLAKEISKIDSIPRLEEIQRYLDENLMEFKFPERLFPDDIKKSIEILKRDFGSSELINSSLQRGDNFIQKKNKINNVSLDFFNSKIRNHVAVHSRKIFDFLRDVDNQLIQKSYLEVSQAIQDFYKDESNDFSSFEEVFKAVFDKTNILYDDNLNKVKIMILLHNMYFNCDIGTNPNADD